jgi:hypothetical protein
MGQHAPQILSRLVRDNGYSTEYAVRLIDYEDGQRCVVYVPYREDKVIYRLRRGREWLDAAEGRELAALLAAYWDCREDLPPRVREAMWRMALGLASDGPTCWCRSSSADSRRC